MDFRLWIERVELYMREAGISEGKKGTMLRENEVLTSLLLEDCGLGPEGLCEMCNAVGMNTTLTSLHLSGNEFDDQSIACLGTMLREKKMLTTLGLNHCGLGPEGLCEVCNAVRMNTTLTYIDLSENRFDDKSITCLGTMLRENKMLTTLGLNRCGLGPEGLCEVCNAVRMNNTLTYINLSENRFDDQNITCLGTMLRENKVLTSLLLMDCGLRQKGLCEVSSALEMSTTLIYLDLSGNTFNNQSIACLASSKQSPQQALLHHLVHTERATHNAGQEICQRFNFGKCNKRAECYFTHRCWVPGCDGEHSAKAWQCAAPMAP
eukprot:Em0003g1742a